MRKTMAVVATTSILLLAPALPAEASMQTVAAAETVENSTDGADKTGLWGLLGLLGLAGLIKRRETDTADRR